MLSLFVCGTVMTISPELRRQIDSCRTTDIDPSCPELASLRQAAQENAEVADALRQSVALDQKIAAALVDVPVPEGLSERIVAKLAEAQSAVVVEKRAGYRRQLLAAIALATAAVMAGLWFGFSEKSDTPELVTQAELADRADGWLKEAFAVAGWRDDIENIPATFAKDNVVLGKVVRWREITTGPESEMVALDLTPAGESARALLLVAVTKAQYELTTLPVTTLPTSGKLRTVAWQKDKSLFVLAVQEEDGQRLEQFLRSQQLTFNE